MSENTVKFYKTKKFLLIIYLIPVVLLLGFVLSFSVNVPIGDEWVLVHLFEKLYTGKASFNDFFVQHNEHRIFFPRIIFLAIASVTKWNVRYEQGVSILLAVITFIAIAKLSFEQVATNTNLFYVHLANILTCMLVFSLVQHENWLWGFQLAWFFINACVVLAVFFLASSFIAWSTSTRIFFSALFCWIASFSLAHGLLSWLAVIPLVVLLPGSSGQRIRRILVWLGLFTASSAIYFWGYQKPSYHPDIFFFLKNPFKAATYFFTFLGSSLVRDPILAPIIGLIVFSIFLGLAAYFLRLRNSKLIIQAAPWLSLGLLAVIFALITTVGRAGFGTEQATASRYTTTSIFLVISLIQMWRLYWGDREKPIKLFGERNYKIFAGIITCLFLVSSFQIIPLGKKIWEKRQGSKLCLELIHYMDESYFRDESPNSCLKELFPSPIAIKSYAEILERLDLRNFPRNIAFVNDSPQGYGIIDIPPSNNLLAVKKNDNLTLAGWAILPGNPESPKVVFFSHGSHQSFFTSAYVNLDSPDVAKALNSKRYHKSRWSVAFSPSFMPLGETVIKAWVYDPYGKRFVNLTGKPQIKVVE
jgi:hypothetical protein